MTLNFVRLQVCIIFFCDYYVSVYSLKKGFLTEDFWTVFCFILSSIEQCFKGIQWANMIYQSSPR